ncbi:hypothetical protein Tco_0194887 [Tanacetum coccineum]
MPTTRKGLSSVVIEQLIAQRVVDAIASYEANQNSGNRIQNEASGNAGAVGITRWFEKMESVFRIYNCAENCQVKYATCTLLDGALTWWNGCSQSVRIDGKVTSSKPTKTKEAICMAHDLMDQVIRAKVANDADNKRKWEDDQGGNSCQQQNKGREVVKVYAVGSSDKKVYAGTYHSATSVNFIVSSVPAQLNVRIARRSATKQETVGPLPR